MKKRESKMARKERRAWLKAIKKLEKFYKKNTPSIGCPLCEVVERFYPPIIKEGWKKYPDCRRCLWVRFEGVKCTEYANMEFGSCIHMCKYSGDGRWVRDSLERLARWKELVGSMAGWLLFLSLEE